MKKYIIKKKGEQYSQKLGAYSFIKSEAPENGIITLDRGVFFTVNELKKILAEVDDNVESDDDECTLCDSDVQCD